MPKLLHKLRIPNFQQPIVDWFLYRPLRQLADGFHRYRSVSRSRGVKTRPERRLQSTPNVVLIRGGGVRHPPAVTTVGVRVRRPVARRTGAIIRIPDDKLRLGLLNRPFPRVSKLVQFCRASLEMQRFVRPTRARKRRRRRRGRPRLSIAVRGAFRMIVLLARHPQQASSDAPRMVVVVVVDTAERVGGVGVVFIS